LYQKQPKLPGEIISRDQSAPCAAAVDPDLFCTRNNRNFLAKSSIGTNWHHVLQVSTPTYSEPKTSDTSWRNHLQEKIGTQCPRCQPRPILYQKQVKLPGEINFRNQSAPRVPGVDFDLFCSRNNRNFLGKSSPRTNRHPVIQLSTSTYFVPETTENFWGNHLQEPIGTACPRC